ncbi:MAG: hypothetical protein DWQ07_18805 [Chloroflexi bacterium]|nr:MAG: hypothetical protein DWQ07_18805 [Chloroflexota bacterium]MBL1194983.1 hypothetical protein [Chloroflexota bacterium]NOH12271.1 hypothetical protein [Chloroflexota bacterium]
MEPIFLTDWRQFVVFSIEGPHPKVLIETDTLKSVIVGLESGQQIPPHPAPTAVYHFLDGSGWMIVDEKRFPVQAGTTIVVPQGVQRGVEAKSKLSFLGTHSGEKTSEDQQL